MTIRQLLSNNHNCVHLKVEVDDAPKQNPNPRLANLSIVFEVTLTAKEGLTSAGTSIMVVREEKIPIPFSTLVYAGLS